MYEHGKRLLLPSPRLDYQGNPLQVSMAPEYFCHTTAYSVISSTSMRSMQRLATPGRGSHACQQGMKCGHMDVQVTYGCSD